MLRKRCWVTRIFHKRYGILFSRETWTSIMRNTKRTRRSARRNVIPYPPASFAFRSRNALIPACGIGRARRTRRRAPPVYTALPPAGRTNHHHTVLPGSVLSFLQITRRPFRTTPALRKWTSPCWTSRTSTACSVAACSGTRWPRRAGTRTAWTAWSTISITVSTVRCVWRRCRP